MKRAFWPLCAALVLPSLAGCKSEAQDEARRSGRAAATFPAAGEDYFREMDDGVALSPEEVKGRNTWLVWTGGNDRFWDHISGRSVGNLDLLKTISSHPGLKASRDNRWYYLGVVNEPCFDKATGPDPGRFGLWLDRRRADCPADPFENEQKYPGVAMGARGKTVPVGSFYGWGTGVVGLRLFPNPDFDREAAERWDAERYYSDPGYYNSRDLVKPYRVGMSCAFCHVGPNPNHAPADPERPAWADLSSNVGAQYFWVDRVLNWAADESNFPYQIFHTSRPGALDTSFVSNDNINNPRTMNAVYLLDARLELARRFGRETLAGGGLANRQINDFMKEGPLTAYYQPPDTVWTPMVLKDGADSVGALGALNRVYLNIGLFSEEWLRHFNPLVGGRQVTPIEISVARKGSAYWEATEAQTLAMAQFFLKTSRPHRLADSPEGRAHLPADAVQLTRGKVVFAERCARCHSSKLPEQVPGLEPGCAGPRYLDCWNRYWAATRTDEFKQKMREIVLRPDFLEGNYLSTEMRVPVTLLETNACSPLATNALAGSIWDNFSSQSYKDLPSVGTITVHHPVTGEPRKLKMPAGGRGYTRPPSLVSLWSTAPYLLNNTVGPFDPSPSMEARLGSFQRSIEQMLWPERRARDSILGDKVPGVIDRTTARSYLRVPAGYLPPALGALGGPLNDLAPWLFGEEGVELGPIPAGTPINLLANLDLGSEGGTVVANGAEHRKRLVSLLLKIKHDLKALPPDATDEQAKAVFADLVEPLLELNKCPDFVVNRGHYFGTDRFAEEPGLSDDDKRALIEFLKTF